MSKDPSFPFYAQDFLTGVMHFNMAERGLYITLLSYQWAHGKIPKKRLGFILGYGWDELWDSVKDKFIDLNEDYIINERLEFEREKRAVFKEKQLSNGSKGGRPNKNKNPNKTQSITQTQTQNNPLENESENEYENKNEVEKVKEGLGEKQKIDYSEVLNIFNAVCSGLPKVEKITTSRKSAINARAKDHGLETIGKVFILASESSFLNGGSPNNWMASFDWIMKPDNFVKVLENNYKNKTNGSNERTNEQIFTEAMESDIGKNFRFS